MPEMHPMYTVTEVAELLRVTEQSVRGWLRKGTLRGIRPGGTKAGWRIPRAAVEALLNADPIQEAPRGTKKLAA